MPRMIRHERKGPVRIDPHEKPVFVCGCGLTKTFPLCDGSHKVCAQEDDATLYTYDKANEKVIEEKPDEQAANPRTDYDSPRRMTCTDHTGRSCARLIISHVSVGP